MVRMLFLAHRYLGIAVGLVMLIWTVSGIIMMYQEYPELNDQESRALLAPLSFAECCELPALPVFSEQGFRTARIEMSGSLPVLRVIQRDGRDLNYNLATGRQFDEITQREGDLLAADFAYREFPDTQFQFAAEIHTDQWTVYGSYNHHRPLYRYRVADEEASEFYISSRTGEIVQLTTRKERVWGYLGAVLHWLYPTVLRQHTAVWAQTVIWLTILGIFLTSIGLYIGIRQYRQRSNGKRSPYRGMALWHHYAGLIFGLLTLTWVFSGLFSMNPWGALEGEGIAAESHRLAGRFLSWDDISTGVVNLQNLDRTPEAVRYEISTLAGEAQVIAYTREGFGERLQLNSLQPSSLSTAQLRALAEELQPGSEIINAELITASDSYYYNHHEQREFPVYRVEFNDNELRRYYLSAVNGSIVRKVDRDARWYRWIFYGLHRGDFSALLRSRPLWDLFMVTLLLGVTVVCFTGTVMGWRRIKRDIAMARTRSLQSRLGTRLGPDIRRSRVYRLALSISALLALVACAEQEAVDWIEVPLQDHTYFATQAEYREGEYDILVLANADLEYKLGMLARDAITYRWTVEMDEPERLQVEFHGHTHRVGDEPGTVMFYKVHQEGEEQGALVAPFEGIHGWWFDNQTNEDITIKLKVAGYYEELDQ